MFLRGQVRNRQSSVEVLHEFATKASYELLANSAEILEFTMVGPEAGDRRAVGTPALSNTQRPILTDLTIAEEDRRSLFE